VSWSLVSGLRALSGAGERTGGEWLWVVPDVRDLGNFHNLRAGSSRLFCPPAPRPSSLTRELNAARARSARRSCIMNIAAEGCAMFPLNQLSEPYHQNSIGFGYDDLETSRCSCVRVPGPSRVAPFAPWHCIFLLPPSFQILVPRKFSGRSRKLEHVSR
jgi:hypothetical protein